MPTKKLKFIRDFPYTPSAKPQVTKIYYARDGVQSVNTECYDRAIAQGYAQKPDDKTKKGSSDAGGKV